jgi:hypothetical protein
MSTNEEVQNHGLSPVPPYFWASNWCIVIVCIFMQYVPGAKVICRLPLGDYMQDPPEFST